MNNLNPFKEKVLKEYPRYGPGDTFRFACHKGLPCFNTCCADITIFLSPYDILRMKNRLGLTSQEFLARYTFCPFTRDQRLPAPVLKMSEDDEKRCPFVSEEGCRIYDDRPWACRMYPLGLASPKEDATSEKDDFYFILRDPDCLGFNEQTRWTVAEWLENQGITPYNRIADGFKEITLHDYFEQGNSLSPEKMEMFYMVCYNLDKFRQFIFESSFLRRFQLEEEYVDSIRSDDLELMRFGFRWLKFCLFGEKTMKIKEEEIRRVRGG